MNNLIIELGEENHILSRIQAHINEILVFPTKDDVVGATLSLMVLALTYRIHPIELVDGKLGKYRQTNSRLSFDDIKHIYEECLRSKSSFFDSGQIGRPDYEGKEIYHYAVAIEWMEAAEE